MYLCGVNERRDIIVSDTLTGIGKGEVAGYLCHANICDHADELGLKRDGYSLWGGSAGARMAATLGNSANLYSLTGRTDLPQASAVIMQYTGYTTVSQYDGPTYACCGTSDGIASWRTMQSRLESLSVLGIPTEFHSYNGLPKR